MNTKIIIATTVAALSLATTAFAGEGNSSAASPYTAGLVADTGAAQYPAAPAALTLSGLNNVALPQNGQESSVESPNAVPPGAMVGTQGYMYAQSVNRYFAQQADIRFAQARAARPNG